MNNKFRTRFIRLIKIIVVSIVVIATLYLTIGWTAYTVITHTGDKLMDNIFANCMKKHMNRTSLENRCLSGFSGKKIDERDMHTALLVQTYKQRDEILVVSYSRYLFEYIQVVYDKKGNVLTYMPTYD